MANVFPKSAGKWSAIPIAQAMGLEQVQEPKPDALDTTRIKVPTVRSADTVMDSIAEDTPLLIPTGNRSPAFKTGYLPFDFDLLNPMNFGAGFFDGL